MFSPQEKKDDRQYLERIPYVSELLKRIDKISQGIEMGYDGVEETLNLLSDLPNSFTEEIKADIDKFQKNYDDALVELQKRDTTGIRSSQKTIINHKVRQIGRIYSRSVKQRIVTLLDDKNLLFLTKAPIERGYLSLYDKEEDKDQYIIDPYEKNQK